MIDTRITADARRAGGERSANATSLNHDIINLVAEREKVTEVELVTSVSGDAMTVLEHLELLARLGFLSVLGGADDKYSCRLSKLGEWAHSTSYFSIHD